MRESEKGASLFARSEFLDNNSMEELFALNLGDFLSEQLISKDLVQKINRSEKNKKTRLIEQIKELTDIYSSNKTLSLLNISSKEEGQAIYNSIAFSIVQMLEIKSCKIYLSTEFVRTISNRKLILAGKSGRFTFNNEKIKEAFDKQKIIKVKNSYYIPMKNQLETVGVILIGSDKPVKKEFIELTEAMAGLFAVSLTLQNTIDYSNILVKDENSPEREMKAVRGELTGLIGDLCDFQQGFVEKLAQSVDIKGQYKVSHSKNTAEVARKICKELKLNEKTTDLIYYAGLLQNIGKIAIPQKLFNTKGKLTLRELKKIKANTNVGVHFLMNINFLSEVVPYITYRTEKFDGTGEPEGLKGNSIPLGSRIIAVADAFCALTSDRPFRKAHSVTKALEILKDETGKKWDSVVINALAQAVQN